VPTAIYGSRLSQSRQSMTLWIGVGTVGSVALALIGSSLGAIPRPSGTGWWFTLPGGVSTVSHLAFYAAIVVLIIGWLGVGLQARAGQLTVRRAWIILGCWGLPLLVGPPIFSRDIYSYIAQGLLANQGQNPYSVAPSALHNPHLLASLAVVWRNTASPYGPLFVMVSRVTAFLSGGSLVVQVLAFRLLEMLGVAMMMVSLPRLARRLGTDPGLALWLGVLSPLALFSFIASGHNDALMVGLLLAGIALAMEGRLAVGVALCALAATIKLPAAAAILFLAVDQYRLAPPGRRWRIVIEAVIVPIVVVVGVTVASGLGWTWLGPTALHVPTELRVLTSPSVAIGTFVHAILHGIGIPVRLSPVVTVTQVVCELVAVAATVWLVVNAHKLDVVRILGLALMVIVVGSPTLWPWYLMWGLAILAATQLQRSKVLAAVAGLAMLAVGPGGTPMLNGGAYFVLAPLLLAGCAWLVWDRHWRTVVTGLAV
jgi:alpha-1,6-mannosyltransferase